MTNVPMTTQGGAVLVVGLLVLVLMALLGAVGMRTAVSEQNMAANSTHYMEAFQAAESAIESGLVDPTALADAISTDSVANPIVRNYTFDHTANSYSISGTATISNTGIGIAEGYSIDEYAAYAFSIQSVANITDVGAKSTHTLTAVKIGPKG